MGNEVHRYTATSQWQGSTAGGYESYDRSHTATAPPAEAQLALSADSFFRGDPRRLNPEQLLVLAASSCQMLSFLAVAARGHIDVVEYRDEAEGVMPGDERPMRITRITLRPHVTVAGEVTEERLQHLFEVAHGHCFIANSLSSEVLVEPTFNIVASRSEP